MPTKGRIVEIGRQRHRKTIKPEFTTDDGRFLEIHAGCPLRRNQLDKGAAVLGHDDAFTARRSSGSLGKACFDLAYRKFHGKSSTVPTPRVD